ncbi:hypothetical protein LTS18_003884, partial [Coniosporium uncinatum]
MVISQIQPVLVELVGLAASYDASKHPKLHLKIRDLLDLWQNDGYYDKEFIQKLRSAADTGGKLRGQDFTVLETDSRAQTNPKDTRDAPYTMPAVHGDPNTKWYNLPAGCMLPHMKKDSTRPINTRAIRALPLRSGEVDSVLAEAVKDYLRESDRIYEISEYYDGGKTCEDVDNMGRALRKDEASGEKKPIESRYGWSVEYCKKMKQRKKERK